MKIQQRWNIFLDDPLNQIWAKSKIERILWTRKNKTESDFLKKRITPNFNRKVFIDSPPTYQILNYKKNWKKLFFFLIFILISANDLCKWLLIINLISFEAGKTHLITRFRISVSTFSTEFLPACQLLAAMYASYLLYFFIVILS